MNTDDPAEAEELSNPLDEEMGEPEILKDPRTGEPLRDQTPAAADTGYLGNHEMQDKTEMLEPKEPPKEDFKE